MANKRSGLVVTNPLRVDFGSPSFPFLMSNKLTFAWSISLAQFSLCSAEVPCLRYSGRIGRAFFIPYGHWMFFFMRQHVGLSFASKLGKELMRSGTNSLAAGGGDLDGAFVTTVP